MIMAESLIDGVSVDRMRILATIEVAKTILTVGGDRLIAELRRSWGPILECRLIGKPPPGVPPGEEAQDGAIRILGVISVLSDRRLLGNALATRRKLLSGEEGDPPKNHPPSMPEPAKSE